MTKKTRNILLIVGAILLFFAGVAGFAAYKVYSFFNRLTAARELPDELKEARILKGAEVLNKKEMFKMGEQNLLKTIGEGAQQGDEKERQKITQSRTAQRFFNFSDIKIVNQEIVAVGEFGGFVFDLNGSLKREILFEPTVEKIKIGWYEQDHYKTDLDNLKIVELEKNKLGFVSFGSVQGVLIFDENGNQIWSYGRENVDLSLLWQDEKERDKRIEESKYVLKAAVGDLDNDGVSEYVVAVKNEGIRVFDRSGKEKWFAADEFASSSLLIDDIDGDGANELVETEGDGRVFDRNGKIVRKLAAADSGDAVLFGEDKSKKKTLIFCDIYKNELSCTDENKNSVLKSAAPLNDIPKKNPQKIDVPGHPEMSFTDDTESASDPRAVWVTFRKDKPKYLAVVTSFIGLPRANFYLYDEKGNLVYHELLDEDAETVAVIPAANENHEIIIGGKNTIWKYALN